MPHLELNGIDIHYESSGSGRPLVLLHGWGTSGRVWDSQVMEFSTDHQVVTVDWRGCGRTSATATGNTIAQVAADLHDLIGALGLDRPIVLGTSMAGSFAVELGIRWPESVGAVITLDSPYHGGVVEDPDPTKGMVAALRAARIPTLKAMVGQWYEPAVGESGYYDWAFTEIVRTSPFADDFYLDHLSWDPRPDLPGIEVPVRLMHGELDPVIPLHYAVEAAELIGQEDVQVLAGCGHFPHHLQPEVFNPALRSTLQSLAAR